MIADVQIRIPARAATRLGIALCCIAATARAAEAPLQVEFSGCAVVLQGPVCVLGDERRLQLWVSSDETQAVRLQAGGAALVPQASTVTTAGVLHELLMPDDESVLTVESGTRQWQLPVQQEQAPPVFADARALARAGDAAAARQLVEARLQHLPAKWHGKALNFIGQLHRREGDADSAQRYLRASMSASAGIGRRSEALKSATVLAYMLITEGGDVGAARAVMESVAPVPPGDAEGQYDVAYHRGLVAFNAGNTRVALRELEQAAAQAGRMGRPLLKSYAESLLAVQLQHIGRHRLAGELLAKWTDELPNDVSPCYRFHLLTNLGWSRLLVLEAGDTGADPMAPLLEALAITRNQCPANKRMNALINVALAHLHAGDPQQAARFVADARRQTDAPRLRNVLWLLDIEARIALARGDTSGALARLEQLDTLASATLSAGARWRAAVGKARVLRAVGDSQGALQSFAAADRLLDDAVYRVPLDAGRETLLTARAWATREHLALLLEAGRNEQALAMLREARRGVLMSLDTSERIAALQPDARSRWETALAQYQQLRRRLDDSAGSAWTLPADALARLQEDMERAERQMRRIVDDAVASLALAGPASLAPARPGELLLALHPLPNGWAVFAHDGATLTVDRSDCKHTDSAELAACLLHPFADLLQQAPVVRVLPSGRLKDVDFHAVDVAGSALVEHAAVVYSADLGGSIPVAAARGRALLVADGLGDLSAARQELANVATTLEEAGWQATRLRGSDARASEVLRGLREADLFHFAGHARFQGELGWDSELKLADGTAVQITDILTLGSAPTLVVLSGCETGRTSGALAPEGVGLANAFIVAGSAGVLATARPVRDATARRLVSHFYSVWTGGTAPHEALRQAQLMLRQAQPDSDWAAYRFIER